MRADRLLAMLIMLQTRGRMTARELSEELEVSERTIYRDMLALGVAGVPVYTERGPGGGCALLESYRTNLTGLTENEVRALFMLSIPAPLVDLGLSLELKAALLKLSAALPASHRQEEEQVRRRIHLDSAPWLRAGEPLPHLQTIHQAVWQDCQLHFTYRPRFGTAIKQTVDPYGLVAKTNSWYLVAAHHKSLRVYRISEVLEARLGEDHFERPVNFDLAAFWSDWCKKYESNRPSYLVTARIAPDLVPALPFFFGDRIRQRIAQVGLPDAAGWITLRLTFESFEAAREKILGFGRAIEVLEPAALRLSVIDFATQVLRIYGS